VGVVLEDQLFQEQESPLVVDLLSNLHARLPCVFSGQSGTLRALSSLNDQGQNKGLLENGSGKDLLLDDDLEPG
jgi:hypothetical protein